MRDVVQELKDKKIPIVYLHFIDALGELRSRAVLTGLDRKDIDVSFIDGVAVNGRLLEGWEHDPEAEWLLLIPELETLKYTSLDEKYPSAFMMSCFRDFELDSRNVLRKVVDYGHHIGVQPMAGIALSYQMLGEKTQAGNDLFRIYPNTPETEMSLEIAQRLLETGIKAEYVQPLGPGYHGIDLMPTTFLEALDHYAIAKWYIRSIGLKYQQKITFEVPTYRIPMSRQPVHMSLWNMERNKNLFFDGHDEWELSPVGKSFIAGILHYYQELITIIALSGNRKENTWRCTYSDRRDDALVNVPVYMKERKKHDRIGWGKRILFNGFDPSCNLYLCASAVMLAGLEGVKQRWELKENTAASLLLQPDAYCLKSDNLFRRIMGDAVIDDVLKRGV